MQLIVWVLKPTNYLQIYPRPTTGIYDLVCIESCDLDITIDTKTIAQIASTKFVGEYVDEHLTCN